MVKHSNLSFAKREAFSLIEVLIVIVISSMLSVIVISNSNISRNITSTSIEAAKISQFMFQARTLAIATASNSQSSQLWCGYGISFDYVARTYSIFAYSPSGLVSCPSSATVMTRGVSPDEMMKYSDATWRVNISKGVTLRSTDPDSVSFVLFYPPMPATLINRVGAADNQFTQDQPSSVHLSPIGDNINAQAVSINPAGQITM